MLTVYCYMLVDGKVKEQSYVVLTDDTRHAKTASVWASYKKLSVRLNDSFPARSHTILVTDGCGGSLIVLIQVHLLLYIILQLSSRTTSSFQTWRTISLISVTMQHGFSLRQDTGNR